MKINEGISIAPRKINLLIPLHVHGIIEINIIGSHSPKRRTAKPENFRKKAANVDAIMAKTEI
ncbi:MAG: hypothetical protein ABJF04_25665 [Reichenbachiella sp.]|uniref:hypothetical protein n=1 Tax=Reichenbachiella sp. TaxID=2184521 RepID=UPI0032643374